FEIERKGEQNTYRFKLTPSEKVETVVLKAYATVEGKKIEQSLIEVTYDHIPKQSILKPAEAKATRLDLKKSKTRIAYLMGASDEIPGGLRQIGYEVDMISVNDLTEDKLSKYETVILGIRAYN